MNLEGPIEEVIGSFWPSNVSRFFKFLDANKLEIRATEVRVLEDCKTLPEFYY